MSGTTHPATADRSPAGIYVPGDSRYDEVLDRSGAVREPWAEWMELCRAGGERVYRSWNKATRRFVREVGVSYSTHRTGGKPAPWSFDPVPWIFGAGEWARIEKGVDQRIRLGAAILDDLYGEQRLIREGIVPMEIVYRDRGFLRPCTVAGAGGGGSGKRRKEGGSRGKETREAGCAPGLSFAALDLARGPEGNMWVVNQRTDGPFGPGFALENRSILSRVLPSLFRNCQVHRLANFFRTWREELETGLGAPGGGRVVILATEGQVPEFETAYLANYLGFVRAVPGDLTVRDERVWLKTLGGLQPVDVIWRAVSGRMLDPLEMEPAPVFGVPGMLQAMRAGNVTVMNHPGTGVLETPGLHPFLPAVSRALLDEALELPTVATWWCGQPRERDNVLANLPRMVIKGIDIRSGFKTTYGSSLDGGQLEALRQRIVSDPGLFVGQEEVHFSTIPCLNGVKLEARSAILRAFALRKRSGEVRVMPGGLARVSSAERYIVSTLDGGISKDVWVRSESPPPRHVSLWSGDNTVGETPPGQTPSRTGECLFWTGRHVERADVTARYLRRIPRSRVEGIELDPDLEGSHERFLFEVLGELVSDRPRAIRRPDDALGELASLLEDEGRPGSLPATLDDFRRVAHDIRDVWSATSLQAIEACFEGWGEACAAAKTVFDFYAPLDRLLLDLTAFVGLSLESMTRDAGWALLDAGRRIERGLLLVELLRHGLARPLDPDLASLAGESVLVIADSLMTYRRRYQPDLRADRVIDLLVFVQNNPRSLAYQFDRLEQFLVLLPRERPGRRTDPLTLVRDARKDLKRFSAEDLSAVDVRTGGRAALDEVLQRQRKRLLRLSDELTISYFSHPGRR